MQHGASAGPDVPEQLGTAKDCTEPDKIREQEDARLEDAAR